MVDVSLCGNCAHHPSLKKIIAEDSELGLCAFCGASNVSVRSTERIRPMVYLLRTLIRFYWNEWSYNSHWGGGRASDLLKVEGNPILHPPSTTEFSDEFDCLLEDPPYPEYDQGVSLYAGFSEDGHRLLNTAISTSTPTPISTIRQRLLTENFHEVEPDLENLIKPFLDDITITLKPEQIWFRARLGHKASFYDASSPWESEPILQPWMGSEISAPPAPIASTGRLNRPGVSVLYVASNVPTAIAEIRPHPGHSISVGAFQSKRALRMADFNPDIVKYSASDLKLDEYSIINAFDRSMSTPVTPQEQNSYLITQVLAEVLRRSGYDGVRFRSSVSSGENLCVFQPSKLAFIEEHSDVRRLTNIEFTTETTPMIRTPTADHVKIDWRE